MSDDAPDLGENINPDRPAVPPFLQNLLGMNDTRKYEVCGPLSAEETKLWNDFQATAKEAHHLAHKAECDKKFFWATIERNRGIYHRSFRIDTKTGLLMVEAEEE